MTKGYERYAVYWVAPQNDPLAEFGRRWTGWCPESGEKCAPSLSPVDGLDLEPLTRRIARHGFHGVLMPAFGLMPPHTIWAVERALHLVADEAREIRVPGCVLGIVSGRVSLIPAGARNVLAAFVSEIRSALAPFSADSMASDRGRTASPADTAIAEEACGGVGLEIGDPDLFHLPLTDALPLQVACQVAERIRPAVAPLLARRLTIGDIALAADPGVGRRMSVLERYALSDRSADRSETFACRGPRTLVGGAGAPVALAVT